MKIFLESQELKSILEEVLLKVIKENREFFKEILEEVMEDIALCRAIEEGRKGDFVDKDEVLKVLSR